jgi:hypothetical protein
MALCGDARKRVGVTEDFRVLIDSLGNATLGMLSSAGLTSVRIFPEEAAGTAHLILELKQDGWVQRRAALERLAEVRSMFIDDIVFDYSFCETGEGSAEDLEEACGFAFA